jgi:subtilase family serine protease
MLMNTIFTHFMQNRLRMCGLAAACVMAATSLTAQKPVARISSEINVAEQTPLKGSLHPLAQAQNDAGRMPGDTRLTGVTLYFNRSAAQEADLQALIVAQQNPASPSYHQWLTPDQFATRFGMAQSDIAQVQGWLERQGFAVDAVNRSHNAIHFSGTVNQVEQAFATQMHYYQVNGNKHFAPSTALSLPTTIASTVVAVRNLDDFRPKPMHIRGSAVQARPGFTYYNGTTQDVLIAPGDLKVIYDFPATGTGETGTGQTIAIMGQSAVTVSDIEAFQNASGLTVKDPTLVLVPGTGTSTVEADGDEGESDLDLEWSGATAPGANIIFVYTGSNNAYGAFDSVAYAIDEKIAPIISLSYGSCEPQAGQSYIASQELILAQASTQGQTVLSASGDQGSTACSGYNISTASQEALAVNYPASSAYVTGMGGTEIAAANDVVGTYWASAVNSTTDTLTSAKSYIPEVAWNDDAISGKYTVAQGGGLSASGGGASAYVARPSWQQGTVNGAAIPSGSFRLVPDVALLSSPEYPGYVYCSSDQSDWSSGQTGSCSGNSFFDSTGTYIIVAGGTSFATPIFAGMLAIINQKAGYVAGQGLINPTLYTLAASTTNYAASGGAFHDITTGNNFCTAGSTYCASNGTTLGFAAVQGYDEVTGLGSVDLNNLLAVWPTNTGTTASLIGTTTTVSPASTTPTVNTADVFTITVSSSTGTTVPTGTVTLQIDGGTASGGTTVAAQALASNGTLTYSATFTTTGTHSVLAQYSGDSTHAASTGVGSINIGTTSSGKGTITLAATNVTESRGTSGTSTITVTPAGGYTGTVLLSVDSSNDNALTNLCPGFTTENTAGDGTVTISGTTAATISLTLDSNAADCANTAAISKTGKRPMHLLHKASNSVPSSPNPAPAAVAFAGLLLAGFMGRYSRKLRNLAGVIALLAVGLAISACGSSSSSTTVSNPPKGTYTITVTGQDSATSSITATTTFTFVID